MLVHSFKSMLQRVRLARSALIGAAATLIDLAALRALIDGLGMSPSAANVPALLLGAWVQFFGNKRFAFGDRRGGRVAIEQGAGFAAVEAGALLLNALLFQLFVARAHLPYLAARPLSSVLVYFGFSYPLWNRIFRQEHA